MDGRENKDGIDGMENMDGMDGMNDIIFPKG